MAENDNMKVYNAVRMCPENALKPIQAGRLKGKSDINPMWRIKALTEQFGMVGVGWYYEVTKQWIETGANSEISAFCNINLYVKWNNEWSKPIQGTGGSSFVAKEKAGLYTSDECFKMALTDAISVACKALGFAADVYWDSDKTKYSAIQEPVPEQEKPQQKNFKETLKEQKKQQLKQYCCVDCGKPFEAFTAASTGKYYNAGQAYHISETKYGRALCGECGAKFKKGQEVKR